MAEYSLKLFGMKICLSVPSECLAGTTDMSVQSIDKPKCDSSFSTAEKAMRCEDEDLSSFSSSSSGSSSNNNSDNEKQNAEQKEEQQQTSSTGATKYFKRPNGPVACPRCESFDTKFCYFNNYNVNQPRHFCKNCQRYWTAGGTLRNVPIGAGRRKNNKQSKQQFTSTTALCSAVAATAAPALPFPTPLSPLPLSHLLPATPAAAAAVHVTTAAVPVANPVSGFPTATCQQQHGQQQSSSSSVSSEISTSCRDSSTIDTTLQLLNHCSAAAVAAVPLQWSQLPWTNTMWHTSLERAVANVGKSGSSVIVLGKHRLDDADDFRKTPLTPKCSRMDDANVAATFLRSLGLTKPI